jgi:hypothetical protein
MILRKYATATTITFPMIKVGSVDFAVSADWPPATGDCKISKDGGNVANTSNLPTAVGGTGPALWKLTLTIAEMSAGEVLIQIVDAATKAVEDQAIMINTYGSDPSALHDFDIDAALVWNSLLADHTTSNTFGDVLQHKYWAVINFNRDNINSRDEYTIFWYRNATLLDDTNISTPLLSVYDRADGSALISGVTPTDVSPTEGNMYKYDEVTDRIGSGQSFLMVTKATIDGAVRTYSTLVSRDT